MAYLNKIQIIGTAVLAVAIIAGCGKKESGTTAISVNGRVVKASYEVKVGDKIEIALGTRTVAVEVLQIAETVRKDDAAAMYKEV